jgi:fermentation-respiration switch protein FrsA (DUF1100 family)
VKSFLVFAVVFYIALVGLLYLAQRNLMYFPDRQRVVPATVGLPQASEETLTTADGEQILVWHSPPREGGPVVLYFQGNGGGLSLRVPRFAALAREGIGLVALNYRGYGGSSGSPSEEGLIADARAAYDFAAKHYAPERIVPWGESLGSGVAVALAAEKPVAKLVLEAPFTSAADVGANAYPFAPVLWLMKDQFRSDERISRVTAPVLILHGERDGVVPIEFGERLYALVRGPKRFVRYPDAGHEGLDRYGALDEVRKFLAE